MKYMKMSKSACSRTWSTLKQYFRSFLDISAVLERFDCMNFDETDVNICLSPVFPFDIYLIEKTLSHKIDQP